MPSAEVVKVLVEHYGWPLVTVVVLAAILWRVMVKHEGQMSKVTEVNQNILVGLQAVASQMTQHDRDEERRHEKTQDRLSRWGQ